MKELSEIIQELVENSNSMNQIDSKTAIQYVVEAYEAGMDKAKELIKDSGFLELKKFITLAGSSISR